MRLGGYVVLLLTGIGLGLAGCDAKSAIKFIEKAAETGAPPPASIPSGDRPTRTASASEPRRALPPAPPRDRGHIRIGSFNIQAFGQSKRGKPHVMETIASLITRVDVMAIQEIRSKDQTLIPELVRLVNNTPRDGGEYQFLLGPRLGRSNSKEQYVYVYDSSRVAPMPGYVYTLPDRYEDFHREPFVARFQSLDPNARKPFTFTLINIHTDPDEIDWELDRLDDALRAVSRDGSQEDDLILLGDLNASDRNLGELGAMRHITPALRGVMTNTRGTKMYDNIVLHRMHTTEFTGVSGVIDFAAEMRLTEREALEISDHLPVFADFYSGEGDGARMVDTPGLNNSVIR